jgi:uncharacterized protein
MSKKGSIITINSRKFDGSIHKSWKAQLIVQSNSLLIFEGVFEAEVNHSHLGVIRRGTISYEYYWRDRFYNIFRFHEADNSLRNFYCNLNTPPTFVDNVLDYIDLDIDLVVWTDFKYQILDIDEFEENARKYNYTENLKQTVASSVKKLVDLIEHRKFPFDTEF